jgi:predicted DNA-binding protein (MmcQ/YjbR family)
VSASLARTYEALLRFALGFPEAHEDHPWGETVAKVRGKVFLFTGQGKVEDGLALSVKLPASGLELLDQPYAEPTGYGLGRSGWVTLRFETASELPPLEVVRGWIEESYRAIAPKRLVAQLDGAAPPPAKKRPAAAKRRPRKR